MEALRNWFKPAVLIIWKMFPLFCELASPCCVCSNCQASRSGHRLDPCNLLLLSKTPEDGSQNVIYFRFWLCHLVSFLKQCKRHDVGRQEAAGRFNLLMLTCCFRFRDRKQVSNSSSVDAKWRAPSGVEPAELFYKYQSVEQHIYILFDLDGVIVSFFALPF